jgi:hypothetical protein
MGCNQKREWVGLVRFFELDAISARAAADTFSECSSQVAIRKLAMVHW